MSYVDVALFRFNQGFNGSQAVLSAYPGGSGLTRKPP